MTAAERLRQLVDEATPGPWRWFGQRKTGMYLAWTRGGRRIVMDFVRQGMRGAQPRFQVYRERDGEPWSWSGMMTPASELAVLEVPYRDDIVEIDHADARLIVRSPEMAGLLADCLDFFDEHTMHAKSPSAILAEAESLFGGAE
jgi:hypothetical protein